MKINSMGRNKSENEEQLTCYLCVHFFHVVTNFFYHSFHIRPVTSRCVLAALMCVYVWIF